MSKSILRILAPAIAIVAMGMPTLAAGAVTQISGVWRTERSSEVTIKRCGDTICGYITKIAVPPKLYKKNKDQIDRLGAQNLKDYFNKDPKLRERPMKGLQILSLEWLADDKEFRGKIYNPQDGNTYTGIVEITSNNTLKLTGCGFFDMICRSESWARVR